MIGIPARPALLGLIAFALLLSLASCAGDESPSAAEPDEPERKVLILGLDGADWEIIDPMIEAGRLPNLARIKREGAHGVLRSEPPLLSPIVWTTIATGRSPLDHGIFGFLTTREGATEPVRSDERQVRAFWNVASDQGVRVGVVGWYATWPAEPVNGYLVSDRLAGHQVRGSASDDVTGLVHPASLSQDVQDLKSQVDAEIGPADARAYFDGGPSSRDAELDDDKLDAFVHILRTTELYRRLAPRLEERFAPAISAVFFEGTDSVGHLFQPYAPPRMPSVSEAQVRRFGNVHARYYDHIDTIVGEFLDRIDGSDTTLVVISDHGFRVGWRRPAGKVDAQYANQAPAWHREEGVIMLWGRGIRTGAKLPESTLYDVFPTLCRLLDFPIADTLLGRPIETAFTQAILDRPIRMTTDYEAKGEREQGELGDIGASEELARLRALGYVGDSVSDSADTRTGQREGHLALPINAYNKSLVLESYGRTEEARATLQELQNSDPSFPLGFFGEATLLIDEANYDDAIPLLRNAISLRPDFQAALAELGEALLRMNDVRGAESALERLVQLEPGHPRANMRLGQIRMTQRRFADARRHFEVSREGLRRDSDKALTIVNLAVLAEQDRQLDRAEQLYKQALETIPNFPRALERYSNLLLYQERHEEALSLLKRLTENFPDQARAWELYARGLDVTGRREEARAALERARALSE